MSNTKTIARNTGWYGLENVISFVVTLFTSIAIARTLGPSKMGYIIYVMWIASVVSSLGGMGIPATTRKYMAEFLGMGDRGTARYIYFRTLMLQIDSGDARHWRHHLLGAERCQCGVQGGLGACGAQHLACDGELRSPRRPTLLRKSCPRICPPRSFRRSSSSSQLRRRWCSSGVCSGSARRCLSMRAVDFLVRIVPDNEAHTRLGKGSCPPAGLPKRMMSFRLAERRHHDCGDDRVEPVGVHPAEVSLFGYPPNSVLFSGIQHGRTASDQFSGLRIGDRRDDFCSVRARQIQDFPPSRLPRFATLR